jgi:F-type H+-transporting ATPase subunit gamma
MAKTLDIVRRIKSVTSTKKITRAMEMVAAAKMRKAIEGVLRTRTYANLSWETVLNLSESLNGNGGNDNSHPLLAKREPPFAKATEGKVKKVGVILITSNRGLCGGFNSAIINKAHQLVKKHHNKSPLDKGGEGDFIEADFILLGKKGKAIYRYFGYNIAAEFPKEDLSTGLSEVSPIAKMVINDYLNVKYDKIMVAYTDFVNAAKQIPRVKQLLPIDIKAQDEFLGIIGEDSKVSTTKEFIKEKHEKHLHDEKFIYEYTFEPSPKEVLDAMIPRLIEVQLYQAVLESNASEHSARMNAMHQATEAAEDMVSELTLFYNKARQASITAEIAEISAGANALR